MIKRRDGAFDVCALLREREEKNTIVDSNCELVFVIVYIQVYTPHSPCLVHTHALTHTHTESSVFLCVCTCKHSPLQQKQSGVIRTVSLTAPLWFLFWGHREREEVSQCASRLPPSLLTTTVTTSRRRYVCLSPCQMPRGWGFHALLGTGPRKSHRMQNTLVMFCVCKYDYVWVKGWVFGCKKRQQFWEQRVKVRCIHTRRPINANLDNNQEAYVHMSDELVNI